MKKYLVESTHGNKRDTEGLPIYVNAVGDYTYADSEEKAIEIYKDTCIEQGASEEENEAADYMAERVVSSYDEIRDAWFADGYHTDDFETIENFEEWLKEHDECMTPEEIKCVFDTLQGERIENR